jgi:DNA-binding NtrC family response regulator
MRILVVNDYPDTLKNLKKGLGNFGHSVVTAQNGFQALKILTNGGERVKPVEVVITHLDIPYPESLDIIQFAKKINPSLFTILFTPDGGKAAAEGQLLDDCKCISGTCSPENLVELIEDMAEGFRSERMLKTSLS